MKRYPVPADRSQLLKLGTDAKTCDFDIAWLDEAGGRSEGSRGYNKSEACSQGPIGADTANRGQQGQ